MFDKLKKWIKGRLLARKQLHDATDPANAAITAVEDALQTKAEGAVAGIVTSGTLIGLGSEVPGVVSGAIEGASKL